MSVDFLFITANDVHINDVAPRSRIDDYKGAILGKLGQMGMVCSKFGADAALIAGDLFDNKEPARNSHELNQDLVRVFKTFPCPIYMVEGNHDMKANRLDSIGKQPLGVLYEDGTLKKLREAVIEKKGVKVSLVGVPYEQDLDLAELKIPPKDGFVSQICVMHLYAGLKAGDMFGERLYGYDELEKLSPDVFVIGHYHVDQGMYEQNGKWFVNIGCMGRGTLAEESLDHKPQIGLVRVSVDDHGNTSYSMKPYPLRVKPASEVFDVERRREEKKESEEIQKFVEKLASEAAAEAIPGAKSIEDVLAKLDLAKAVKDCVMKYIHQATAKAGSK